MDKKLTKNIVYKFILNVFNLIVPLLIGPYIMRVLTPNQIGELNFAQSIIGYFFVFASFGVYQYGLREISRVRNSREKLEDVFTNLFLITIISNFICLIAYFYVIMRFYSNSDIYLILIILSINFVSNAFYVEWVNEATENFNFITKKSVVVRILYVISIFAFVKSSSNFNEYIYIIIGSTFLNNVISYFYVKNKFKFRFKRINLLKHIKPMFYVVILTNAGILYTQMDKFMLGEFTNNVQVAFYSTGQNIMRVINILLLTLIEATVPRLSMYVMNDKNLYNKLLNDIVKYYLIILFPAALGLMFLSKEIMVLYAGKQYINSYITLAIFSIYMISIGYENIISNQVMYLNGKEKVQIRVNFIGGILNVILNLIFIKINIFNAYIAILTTLISNIFVLSFQYIYIKIYLKDLKLILIDKEILRYILFSFLFLPLILIVKFFFENYIFIVIVSVLICSVVYFTLLFIREDKIICNIVFLLRKKFLERSEKNEK